MKPIRRLLLSFTLLLATFIHGYGADRTLNLYIWSEYIPDEVIAAFTKETGIKVNVSTYDSNEAMYAKVKLVGKGYDLVVPSSDYVGLMRRQGLLMPIETGKIPNFSLLLPQFKNQAFDPGNGFSIPYMWGSTAIAINTDLIPGESMRSLADLWNPALKGRLLLPNDPREVMAIGLKALGYSVNEKNPDRLHRAFEKLQALMPQVRVFDSDSPKQALLSGEVAAGVVWNGEAYIANGENNAISYVYPKEGYSLWLDSFCMPKGAEHVEAAYLFLDYILRPEVSAAISTAMGYSSPNGKAMEHLKPELKNNSIVYPDANEATRGEFLDSLDAATLKLYEAYWVRLKTSK